MSELRRALMRQVISPPPCTRLRGIDRAVVAVFEVGIVFACLSFISALLRMCEP